MTDSTPATELTSFVTAVLQCSQLIPGTRYVTVSDITLYSFGDIP